MKKYYILPLAALAASCANDDILVNGGNTGEITGPAITFGSSNVSGQTRGSLTGSDAANKLNNEFVVFGVKHTTDGNAVKDQNVFTNYKVVYENNTAGTSETNTNNWEYVGKTPYLESYVSPAVLTQSVKYWDYSADKGYTFTAFSGKNFLMNKGAKITKITDQTDDYKNGYSVVVPTDVNPGQIYFSDRVKMEKSPDYSKLVTLTFRNFGARVRVGFYETVPGYSVKIDKFYFDNTTVTGESEPVTTFKAMKTESTDKFTAALRCINSSAANNTLTVTYNDNNSGIENQPTVTGTTVTYTNTLSLGTGIVGNTLKKSSSDPTWDNNGNYTTVYPNEACNSPMLIRCDYTLYSDDNSGENIKVKNARVVVPAEYCKWKPNFAYTYIFKISDNTNGTTGNTPSDPDDPSSGDAEGLHPITFDAVAVDVTTGNQETITTVSTNNVTTYAKNASQQGDYKGNQAIYVVNEDTKNHTVIAPTAIGTEATKSQVYKLDKAATEGEVMAQLNGTKMGIKLTAVSDAKIVNSVPSSDDTNLSLTAVTFTPAAVTSGKEYYAYVYTTTAYTAAVYEPVVNTTTTTGPVYSESTTYYFKTTGDVYYTASKVDEAYFNAHKSELYTQKTPATPGVYDVKVITVVQ